MTDVNSGVAIPQPKRLSVSETEDGLIQIEIQLRRRRIFVSEMNFFSSFKLGNLLKELYAEFNPVDGTLPKDDTQVVKENLLLNVWAPLAICSTGDVPTKEEFLQLPEADIQFWVETARELGVKFPWLDDLEAVIDQVREEAKKKARKRTRQK